jgi:hypothetical protein
MGALYLNLNLKELVEDVMKELMKKIYLSIAWKTILIM